MQKKCDLYFHDYVNSSRLKLIALFDGNFKHVDGQKYIGFLQINVIRIKLISVISDLRKNNLYCFSVPIEYRDCKNISFEVALELANTYAARCGATVSTSMHRSDKCPPLIWIFDLIGINNTEEQKAGGVIMVDRIDGHEWSTSEYEEYLYDYNNVF